MGFSSVDISEFRFEGEVEVLSATEVMGSLMRMIERRSFRWPVSRCTARSFSSVLAVWSVILVARRKVMSVLC